MQSREYRDIIARIARNVIKRGFPGGKRELIEQLSRKIAVNIHARMYGANVDNVDSPIWHDPNPYRDDSTRGKPTVDAAELIKQGYIEENI